MLEANQLVGFGAGGIRSNGNDAFTKLLLHMNGTDASTTFTDSSSIGRAVTANGNAQIDTAQSKFGGASGLFDGTGDYLSTPDSADWSLGTTDWTFDLQIRANSLGANHPLFEHYTDANNFFGLSVNASNFLIFKAVTGGMTAINIISSLALTTNIFYHIAVVCSSGTITLYIDGVSKASGTRAAAMPSPTSSLFIGFGFYMFGGSFYWNGWIDEFRMSAIGRNSSDFPPTIEYS